jgi:signal transduction histidine kinase
MPSPLRLATREHPWLAAGAGLAAGPAEAAAAPAGSGPWIFGAVALVLVAGLAYLAGSRSRRGPAGDGGAAPPATAAEDTASLRAVLEAQADTLHVWRRDAQGQWSAVGAAGAGPAAALPRAAAEAMVGLRPGSQASAAGWTLAHRGAGAAERIVAWRTGDAASANDAATFSFTVSHDLRAPVRVVEGFTRIVKEDYGRQLDRIANDHLDRVLAAAARMNSMIDAMLALARLSAQPLQRAPVDLSQLAGYVVDDLRRAAPERRVEVEIEPGLKAEGDPTLLRQVVENLISNAWKYTGRREIAHIAFRRAAPQGRPAFEVADDGAGFDMRLADRLFGLFQRLHSANDFPGTGVGLASVRRIVQRHGGEIWAVSAPGEGARFYFTLAE